MKKYALKISVSVLALMLSAYSTGWVQADRNAVEERIRLLEQENERMRGAIEKQSQEIKALMNQLNQRVDQLETKEAETQKKLETVSTQAQTGSSGDMTTAWKNRLRWTSENKDFDIYFGGSVQNDWGFFLNDNLGEDGVEFRRARIEIGGILYNQIEFKAQYDFAGGDADFVDVYMGLLDVPVVGNLRLGHFKEPFGMERSEGVNYTVFLERGLTDLFTPVRNTGLMVHNNLLDERMWYGLGVFREVDSFGDNTPYGEDSWNVTGRITGLPYYEEDGAKLVHVGAGFTYKDIEDYATGLTYRPKPEANLGDRLIGTAFAPMEPESLWTAGAEAALVYGPFSLQGEYMHNEVNQDTFGDADFSGYYVFGSYFLTGEHRNYKKTTGTFDRLSPNNNFLSEDGGIGAWEIALRYSSLDLEDNNATVNSGDQLDDITAALNWYLNPNVRVMWNYVHAELENADIDDDIVQMRFQIVF